MAKGSGGGEGSGRGRAGISRLRAEDLAPSYESLSKQHEDQLTAFEQPYSDYFDRDAIGAVGSYAAGLYTGSFAAQWNKELRLGTPGKLPGVKPAVTKFDAKNIDQLQEVILSAPPLDRNLEVYRGLTSLGHLGTDLKPGAQLTDRGFVSTGIREITAEEFAVGARGTDQAAIVTVRLPKGSRVLAVQPRSQHPFEHEVLLPHGSRFVVESIGQPRQIGNPDNPLTLTKATPISLRYLGPEPKP